MTTARERYLNENGDDKNEILIGGGFFQARDAFGSSPDSGVKSPISEEVTSGLRREGLGRTPRQSKPTVQYNVKLHLRESAGVIYLRALNEPTVVRDNDGIVVSMSCPTWINGHICYLDAKLIAGVTWMREKYKEDPANYEPTFQQYDFEGGAPFRQIFPTTEPPDELN